MRVISLVILTITWSKLAPRPPLDATAAQSHVSNCFGGGGGGPTRFLTANPLGCCASSGNFVQYSCQFSERVDLKRELASLSVQAPVYSNYTANCVDSTGNDIVTTAVSPGCYNSNQADSAGYLFGKSFCNSTAAYYYGCGDSACTNCTSALASPQGAKKKLGFSSYLRSGLTP
jgi:hypothetical protein